MHFIAIMLIASNIYVSAQSEQHNDSTDVFYRHLQLKEVVVTGSTGATKLKESSSPVAVLSERQLLTTASSNLIDAVAQLPGVSQITTGSGISKPVIRGLGYNRIVVVNDGIRQEGQQWGDEHGIEVDAAAVSSVEVLKGPASLIYGSDAMAGVLRFNSAPIVPMGKMRASLNAEYQTNNGLVGYSFNFAGNKRGNVWDARYSEKWAHAYSTPYDHRVTGSQFHERAVRLMGGMNRGWGHSRLTLSYYHITPSIVEGERDPLTGELVCEYGTPGQYDHGMPYQQVRHYKAASDNVFYLGTGKLYALLGYQFNSRQEFDNPLQPNDYALYLKLHTASYNVYYQWQPFEGWQFTTGLGGMYQRSINGGEEALIPDYNMFDVGVYGTASKQLDRWTLSGGLRYDHRHLHGQPMEEEGMMRFVDFSRRFGGVTGSVGAVFHAHEQWDLRANVSRGFRAPNVSELASNGVHEGSVRFEIGNHDLKPEYSTQFDLGMDFSSHLFTAQVSLFANLISNYIFIHRVDEVVEPGLDTYRFDSGDSRLWGGELSADFHPFHSLHLGTAFGWVNAIQLHQPEESKYLPFTPAPRWTTDIKYEILHNGTRLNNAYVSVNLDCTFKQNHYYAAGGTETATPAYALLGCSAGVDVLSHGKRVATITLIGTNLTNKGYQSHLSRLKYCDVNDVTGRRGVHNMGRNFVVKVTIPVEW